jgi:hypothetical protein
MYDTGWYMPDYGMTSASQWGRGRGCSFATEKCLTPGDPPSKGGAFPEWCVTPGLKGCDYLRLGVGSCNVVTWSGSLPSQFQYYTADSRKAGSNSHNDYCPYTAMYSNKECSDAQWQPTNNYYGETYGSGSRCFGSNAMARGYTSTVNPSNAGCFTQRCQGGELQVYVVCGVKAANYAASTSCSPQWLTCPSDATLTLPESLGYASGASISCPLYREACPSYYTGLGPPPGASPAGPAPSPAATTSSPTAAPTWAPLAPGATPHPTAAPTTASPTAAPTASPMRVPTATPSVSPTVIYIGPGLPVWI